MDGFSNRFICFALPKIAVPAVAVVGACLLGGVDCMAQKVDLKARNTTEPVHKKIEPLKNLVQNIKQRRKDRKHLAVLKQDPKKDTRIAENGSQGNHNIRSVPEAKKPNLEGSTSRIPGRGPSLDNGAVKSNNIAPLPKKKGHSLDPAIEFAHQRLQYLNQNISDYTGVIIKQERISGKLLPAEYMRFKVRNRREENGQKTPLSVYMRFFRPSKVKGREVIFVEGRNKNKLIAHEAEPFNFMSVHLDPTGMMAMRNNRYPVTDFGIQNLIQKLIERASRDREHGDCKVDFFENAVVRKRPCSMIQVTHDEQKAPFDFHIARIYIDNEYKIPVRYEAYTWPEEGCTELPLLESYTYAALKFNVGLTDKDFDPNTYDYP